ncbi:MAG: MaoC family dehydratase [Proteobacteria bacterium]|nr:MaoC family dehydratase [Pseudomonadota bacterium]
MNTLYDFKVGDKESYTMTMVDADVVLYACMTGDFNPIHIDDAYAEKGPYGQRVVHDMLVAGLISTVLGTKMPGPGSSCIQNTLEFLAPVYIGDTVTASVQVISRDMGQNQMTLSTQCVKDNGTVVIKGHALMRFLEHGVRLNSTMKKIYKAVENA